jgi:hypothetical protein
VQCNAPVQIYMVIILCQESKLSNGLKVPSMVGNTYKKERKKEKIT